MARATIAPLGIAAVSVKPAAQSHPLSDSFDVDIMLEGADDLGGFQFDLGFDPAILKLVSVTGSGFLPPTVTELKDTATAGVLHFGQFSNAAAGVNGGPYKLATVRFQGIKVGTSPLDLSKVILTSAKGFPQDKTVADGQATIVPLPTSPVRLVVDKACVDSEFTVKVLADNPSNLGSYEFKLSFNPALIGGGGRRATAACWAAPAAR